MLQLEVANIWLRDQLLIGQGLLSRMLFTAPDSAMGGRLSHNEAPGTPPGDETLWRPAAGDARKTVASCWKEAKRASAAAAAIVSRGGSDVVCIRRSS